MIKGSGGTFSYTGDLNDFFCNCQQPAKQTIVSQQTIPKDPHECSVVQCDLCNHKWVAVRPIGLTKLECPNCNNLTHFENIQS